VGFTGWPTEAVEFFSGLQADNTKAYWTAHKAVYEELLGELSGEFGPGRIARPYRDVRFRADKSPYKTEIYASLDRGGYVRFAADGLTAAVGYYLMSGAQLERYRRAVDDDIAGARLAQLVARFGKEGLEVGGGQALKTAPRGYRTDHPRIELLRYRSLICWQHWPVAPWLHTGQARDRVAGFLRTAAPVHRWLDENVGPDPPTNRQR